MRKPFFIFILLILYFHSVAKPDRGFQIWNRNDFMVHLFKNVSLDVAQKTQYSPERNSINMVYGEMFLAHAPVNWFEYGVGFRIAKSNIITTWLQENRTMAIANLSEKYKKFNFKLYNRFEYRSFENNINYFRYREEFRIEFPKLTNWGMQFYTSEEAYFRFNGTGLQLARLYEGINVVQKEHFKMKLYYALEKNKLADIWATSDIFGFNFSFVL